MWVDVLIKSKRGKVFHRDGVVKLMNCDKDWDDNHTMGAKVEEPGSWIKKVGEQNPLAA